MTDDQRYGAGEIFNIQHISLQTTQVSVMIDDRTLSGVTMVSQVSGASSVSIVSRSQRGDQGGQGQGGGEDHQQVL